MTSQTNCHKKHIVVFTGAGISAESGLHTFRDPNGLWQQYSVQEVATPSAWKKDRKKVLDFYNLRRQQVRQAAPNAAHIALTTLQKHFKVSIITQNVDDLHERAGSKNVLHLHGEIIKARSTVNKNLVYDLGEKDIALGDKCEKAANSGLILSGLGKAFRNLNRLVKLSVKQIYYLSLALHCECIQPHL